MNTLSQRRKRQRSGTRKSSAIRSEPHLQHVRGYRCAVQNEDCAGKIQAHHVRLGAHAGMSQKPGDDKAVPLCVVHHDEVHNGAQTFEQKHRADLAEIAKTLWQRSPHRWHFWHWRLQVHPLQKLRRWLFTRCSYCNRRIGWNHVPVRSGSGLYHHDCRTQEHQTEGLRRIEPAGSA